MPEKAEKQKKNRDFSNFMQPHGCGNRKKPKTARNSALLSENARKIKNTDKEAKMFGKKHRFAVAEAFCRRKTLLRAA